MKKSSASAAIAATIVGVLAMSASAFADPQPLQRFEPAPSVRMHSGAPEGMTAQQWKAQLIRGRALNKQYDLGAYAKEASTSVESPASANAELDQRYHLGTSNAPLVSQAAEEAQMNERYHLGTYMSDASIAAELRGEAMNAKYGNAWTKMPTAQYVALVRLFGNNITQHSPAQLKALLANGEQSTLARPSTPGFDWRDFGIGVGAALAAMLAVLGGRRIRRTPKLQTA